MIATVDLNHNEPHVSRFEGKAILLTWGGLKILLPEDEALTLADHIRSALEDK